MNNPKELENLREEWTPRDKKLFQMLLELQRLATGNDKYDPISICKYIESKFYVYI